MKPTYNEIEVTKHCPSPDLSITDTDIPCGILPALLPLPWPEIATLNVVFIILRMILYRLTTRLSLNNMLFNFADYEFPVNKSIPYAFFNNLPLLLQLCSVAA